MLADQTWPNFEGSEKDGVKVILQTQNLDKDVRYVYLINTFSQLKVSKFRKQFFLFSFEPKTNEIIFWFLS